MGFLDSIANLFKGILGGGGGSGKGYSIPAPRSDNGALKFTVYTPLTGGGTKEGTARLREAEATAALRAYVTPKWIVSDRDFVVRGVTFEDGKAFYLSQPGNNGNGWPAGRTGMAYVPNSTIKRGAQIHLVVNAGGSVKDRAWLTLHEYAHLMYQWLLTWEEWQQITAWGGPEEWANNLASHLFDGTEAKQWKPFIAKIEARLPSGGSPAVRE
jgi:hypothetical protein